MVGKAPRKGTRQSGGGISPPKGHYEGPFITADICMKYSIHFSLHKVYTPQEIYSPKETGCRFWWENLQDPKILKAGEPETGSHMR